MAELLRVRKCGAAVGWQLPPLRAGLDILQPEKTLSAFSKGAGC